MSTPPTIMELSQNEKIKFNNSQSFDIKENKTTFKLKLSYNDKILFFEIEKSDQFPKDIFTKYLTIDELGKIDRFFRQFDTLLEVVDSLKLIINNNNLSVIEEDKQIKLQITNPSNQKTFFIEIPQKEKDLKTEMDTIIPYIISLRDKVDNLEKQLKEKTNALEEKINELMSIKVEYEKLKKEEIKKENRYFKNSNIIKLEEENIILNWFERKPIRFIKLLDSKIDGDSTSAFINKCANKCPTILFVKTTNGYRFGGYTTKLWTKSNYVNDDKCFVFSLDKKEKYNITNSQNATYYDDKSFFFGSATVRLYNNCTSNQNNYVDNGSFSTVPQNYGINGGEYNFTVSCYEIYQLEY